MNLYNAFQTRTIDAIAMKAMGVSGKELMERAGASAFSRIAGNLEVLEPMVVLCGPGNNGGDGYVVARLARQAGLDVQVIRSGEPKTEDSRSVCAEYVRQGGRIREFDGSIPNGAALIVDALLGTGLNRPPSGKIQQMIESANRSACRVVSLDVPSGLQSDTGFALEPCMRALMTVSFISRKIGCYTGDGREMCGALLHESLDVPGEVFQAVEASARTIVPTLLQALDQTMHKRQCGHLMVVGGESGMLGATLLAGKAALRSGCGLVTVCSTRAHLDWPSIHCPELMSTWAGSPGYESLLERCDALVLGPGLGQSDFGRDAFKRSLHFPGPMVVDADGLNLLSRQPSRRHNWILTPHPGEAARLLGCSTQDIRRDGVKAAAEIVRIYGGICVLKGAGTVVLTEQGVPWVCNRGNPGMASAGMGDVLSGVIGALLAGGHEAGVSATTGTWLHSAAADYATRKIPERALTASRVIDHIDDAIRQITVPDPFVGTGP